MRLFILFFTLLCLTLCAQAQPAIRAASVVNAANNLPPGLPNAGLAQGGMFILKGRNLGAKGTVIANSFPLGTTMGGTSMKITVGATTVNVIMVYVVGGLTDDQGPFDQLAGIVPSNTPTGNGTLTATFNNQTSAPVAVKVLTSAFGIFTINQNGSGPGVFTDPNFKVNTLINSAHTGDQLFIWGTGLGPISGSDANAPPVGNLDVPAEVYVGGIKAAIGYQGRSGCCSGIDQILITIPPGVQGCYVSVVVKIGTIVSNFVTISVAPSGSICSDAQSFSVSDLQKAQTNPVMTIAAPGVFRLAAKATIPGMGTLQGNDDQGSAYFQKYSLSPSGVLAALPIGIFPSAGCIVYTRTTGSTGLFDSLTLGPAHDFLTVDAGPTLNLTGPMGAAQILRQNNSGEFRYKANLGGSLESPPAPDYLVPGTYTLNNGSGGADVGGFSASLTVPAVADNLWANEDAIVNISRSQDLNITINPPGDNLVLGVVGNSVDPSVRQNGIFQCAIPPGATSFSVPGYVLAALPQSGVATDSGGARIGFLGVAVALASPARFQARGIDAGSLSWAQVFIKNVNYQ